MQAQVATLLRLLLLCLLPAAAVQCTSGAAQDCPSSTATLPVPSRTRRGAAARKALQADVASEDAGIELLQVGASPGIGGRRSGGAGSAAAQQLALAQNASSIADVASTASATTERDTAALTAAGRSAPPQEGSGHAAVTGALAVLGATAAGSPLEAAGGAVPGHIAMGATPAPAEQGASKVLATQKTGPSADAQRSAPPSDAAGHEADTQVAAQVAPLRAYSWPDWNSVANEITGTTEAAALEVFSEAAGSALAKLRAAADELYEHCAAFRESLIDSVSAAGDKGIEMLQTKLLDEVARFKERAAPLLGGLSAAGSLAPALAAAGAGGLAGPLNATVIAALAEWEAFAEELDRAADLVVGLDNAAGNATDRLLEELDRVLDEALAKANSFVELLEGGLGDLVAGLGGRLEGLQQEGSQDSAAAAAALRMQVAALADRLRAALQLFVAGQREAALFAVYPDLAPLRSGGGDGPGCQLLLAGVAAAAAAGRWL